MTNQKKSFLLAAMVAVGLAVSASASAQSNTGSGPNPYSDCGIGAALFSETKWAAVTSNVIWDLGTTAVISATASPQTCSGKKMVAAAFILGTYEKLAEETAAGRGEHLATVLNVLECKSEGRGTAVSNIRAAMGAAVSHATYANQSKLEKSSNLYSIVESAVRNSCAV
jgi:hypothetical protein